MLKEVETKQISVAHLGKITLVEVPEVFTILEVSKFKKTCEQLLEEITGDRLILDFGKTKFLDSSAIGILMRIYKLSQEKKIILNFWSVGQEVTSIFRLTRLDKLFLNEQHTQAIFPPEEIAIQSISYHPSVRSPLKKTIDILAGFIGLLVIFLLFIPISIALKMDSNGSIFSREVYLGLMGRPFFLWRFNTQNQQGKTTPTGKFLKKTKLDKLPEFINILRGELSLVGVKPLKQEELETYDISQWQHLDVKPGFIGQWRLLSQEKIDDFSETMQLDLQYQKKWNHRYDLKLIWQTCKFLLRLPR